MPAPDAHLYIAFHDTQGKLIFPPPYAAAPSPVVLDAELLTEAQRALWDAIPLTSGLSAARDSSHEAWEQFLASAPPAPFAAIAQFRYALELERQGRAEALDQFRQISANTPSALGESGLPLKPLADWHAWRLAQATNNVPASEEDRLNALCREWVFQPSAASPVLLAQAAEQSPLARPWLAHWENHQMVRNLFQQETLRGRFGAGIGRGDNLSVPVFYWTELEETWLGEWFATSNCVAWQPLDVVRQTLRQFFENSKKLPDYAAIRVDLAGTNLFIGPNLSSATNRLVSLGTAHAPGNSGNLSVTLNLANPGLLYARQRVRAWWLAGLIVVAAGGALIGLVATWRAMRRQERLIALKSNFVSSVTHELRAPLASVRLMAESLERGKITQPEKRQDYFRYIVQECRRLSGLIENVLDFARIEQGRKEYQLEPVALEELIRQTAQVLEPYAAERAVRLAVKLPEGNHSLACDAQAIQQALVNLIDNAVKHAPPGSEVAVGLNVAPSMYGLWVEDGGPGIPPEEHARIFEQFYRRGSELRRESAGVGIGLTLVKHIAEAHHGQVCVRSAVGQGSRFTLELPRTRDIPTANESQLGRDLE